MPIATNLVATYSNSIQGMTRTLLISAQDTTALTISGSWASSINGIGVSFPVSGSYVPAPSSGSSALLLVLSGSAQVAATGQQPPIMRALNAVIGYAEVSGPGQVDRLFITIAWAEDNPGNAKSTSAWTPLYLDRQ